MTITDRAAFNACERFLDDHRLLVEPACGAAPAIAYEDASRLDRYETVLVVVCGGATASVDQLRNWAQTLA